MNLTMLVFKFHLPAYYGIRTKSSWLFVSGATEMRLPGWLFHSLKKYSIYYHIWELSLGLCYCNQPWVWFLLIERVEDRMILILTFWRKILCPTATCVIMNGNFWQLTAVAWYYTRKWFTFSPIYMVASMSINNLASSMFKGSPA